MRISDWSSDVCSSDLPHQRIDLDGGGALRVRPQGWHELQRTHAARAGVAQSLDRVETVRSAALGCQPGIDQGIAETIGQRIGQQSGQAMKRRARKLGKLKNAIAQRQNQRRDYHATARERSVELEWTQRTEGNNAEH